MTNRRSRTLWAVALLCGAIGCTGDPLPFLSGGALSGPVRPVPTDWSFVGGSRTAQLETDPTAPYSVNLNVTVVDGAPYINAGDTETQWVKNIAADPAVRLRIDGTLYELRALRVTDPEEIRRFGAAWTAQSRFARDPAALDEAWVYRLVAR